MGVRAHEISLTDDADAALRGLEASADPRARSVARKARALRATLLADALHGEVVKRPLPKTLVKKHGVDNLYVEDLPDFWRLLYTLVRVGVERHVVVVEIVDHPTYDKWFGGKAK
ncbi:MAG: hypothetical protein QOE90_2700 [Thermoplasmata archaeon]|jgi:hypothetical protein|nr:hypothetical protein [Thermoplasmata archaeon]